MRFALSGKHPKPENTDATVPIAVAVVVVFLIVWSPLCSPSEDRRPGGSGGQGGSRGDVHGAWAYMQLFVEKELKSPKSADFPFGGFRHVTYLGNDRYEVDSYVDAENSFGASIRTRFKGVIKKVANGWELESLSFK